MNHENNVFPDSVVLFSNFRQALSSPTGNKMLHFPDFISAVFKLYIPF